MFSYVPILKSKAGERWALGNVGVESAKVICPLIELHPPKKKKKSEEEDQRSPRQRLKAHLSAIFKDLTGAWPGPFFLDPIWIGMDSASMKLAFAPAQGTFLQFIPVTRLTLDAAARQQMKAIIEQANRGYMIRVEQENLDELEDLHRTIQFNDVPIDGVDLLIDFKSAPVSLDDGYRSIPHLSKFRSVTVASGAFPSSISDFPEGRWKRVKRFDWESWAKARLEDLPRVPVFGDYGTRQPGKPMGGGDPSANIRYTTAKDWMVCRGGKLKLGGAKDMHDLAITLVGKKEFQGDGFSPGDRAYAELCAPVFDPGGPREWVQWSINHHLHFAVDQIRRIAR